MRGAIRHLRFQPVPVALAIAIAFTCFLPASADEETIEELLAKAKESRDQQAEIYAKVARRHVEMANDYFLKGEVEKAHSTVDEAVKYAAKALEAAKQTRKRLKQTDITLRKTSRRLSDIAGTLAFADRPAVNEAVKKMEELRMQLLEVMFELNGKSENKPSAEDPKKN
jgi:YesN/AraC family two-component response regulator